MAIINDYVICKAFRVILQPGLQWIASSAFDGKTITRNNRMNMKGLYLILLSFLFGCNLPDMQTGKEVSYYFDQPAQIWEETLPLGNGRLGMMPDGGVVQETIVLNDITMWSGSFQDTRNPEASGTIPVHTVQQPASSLINMPHLHPHRHILRNH